MLALGMLVNGSAVTIGSQRFLRGRPAGAFILVWRLDDGIVVAEISQEEVASREPARTWTRSRHWEPHPTRPPRKKRSSTSLEPVVWGSDRDDAS